MKNNKSASLFQKEQVMESLKQSFVKLNPRILPRLLPKQEERRKPIVCVRPVKRLPQRYS